MSCSFSLDLKDLWFPFCNLSLASGMGRFFSMFQRKIWTCGLILGFPIRPVHLMLSIHGKSDNLLKIHRYFDFCFDPFNTRRAFYLHGNNSLGWHASFKNATRLLAGLGSCGIPIKQTAQFLSGPIKNISSNSDINQYPNNPCLVYLPTLP